MNRAAKIIRVLSGVCLLVTLFFVIGPLTVIRQENYSDIVYTPLKYMMKYADYSQKELVVMGVCILLPLLLALVGGVAGVVGSAKQNITGILAIIVCGLYVALLMNVKVLWPEAENDAQEFGNGLIIYCSIAVSGLAAVLGVISFFVRPKKPKQVKKDMTIPNVDEIKREQIEAQYSFLENPVSTDTEKQMEFQGLEKGMQNEADAFVQPQDVASENTQMPENTQAAQVQETVSHIENSVIQSPRGVMVGLAGIFAGAEIPFQGEESIRLGRDASNDLVFTDAKRVSRHHCVITWHAARQEYSIVDRSSNGSFINGQTDCLPQNIEIMLKTGTVIDIGSEENRFRLE